MKLRISQETSSPGWRSFIKNKKMKKEIIPGFSKNQLVELIDRLGGEDAVWKLLSGRFRIKIEDQIVIDQNGCFVPLPGLSVCEYENTFLPPKKIYDYESRLDNFSRSFPGLAPSLDEYHQTTKDLVRSLKLDPVLKNLLHGLWLPIILPNIQIVFSENGEGRDYGEVLEAIFLKEVGMAYQRMFPDKTFCSVYDLKNKTSIIDNGHKILLEKMAKKYVVCLIFFPFRGFSFNAAQSFVRLLPENFILPGPIGIMTAQTLFPDVLLSSSSVTFQCGATVANLNNNYTLYSYVNHQTGSFVYTKSDTSQLDEKLCTGLIYTG